MNKQGKRLEFQIYDEFGNDMGFIFLPKDKVRIIGDMLRIYCKYDLIKQKTNKKF